MENFDFNLDSFEKEIESMEVDEVKDFNVVDYDKFIILPKSELAKFIKIVDPVIKSSVDDYGKTIRIRSVSDSVVELSYSNNPYYVTFNVENKSKKQVDEFNININSFKKIVSNSAATLVIVQEGEEYSMSLCGSLLYLETKKMDSAYYKDCNFESDELIDSEKAIFSFKKLGSILNQSDRASEKLFLIKNNEVVLNTGVFLSKSVSPFLSSPDMVLFKSVADIIVVLCEISDNLFYKINKDTLQLGNGNYFLEVPLVTGERVESFSSPVQESLLSFTNTFTIINDNLLNLISAVRYLDYLSEFVKVSITKDKLTLSITTSNLNKTSDYSFDLVDGTPDIEGNFKISVNVLYIFLSLVGFDIKYSFTEYGLGIKTDKGSILLRKGL